MIFTLKTMKILKVIKNSHFQNEAGCKTVLVKMSFIRVEVKKSFNRPQPRFKTEHRGNSEMAYSAYERDLILQERTMLKDCHTIALKKTCVLQVE